jgi:lipoprotein-anchoring transpeptidase ErfK/SrfK
LAEVFLAIETALYYLSAMTHLPLGHMLGALLLLFSLSSCSLFSTAGSKKIDPNQPFVNPHPPGTHAHFAAEPSYPKTFAIYKNSALYAQADPTKTRMILDTTTQRGKLMLGDEVLMDYPISSGRSTHPSPTGRYQVLEKIVDKKSNRYGKIYDVDNQMINGDADFTTDVIPEGGRFEGAFMKYWMRFTWDGVGHHIGPIPSSRRAVSHGCIRGYHRAMPDVYAKVIVGTPVLIL